MAIANGRLFKVPVVTLIPTATGLRVRVDDDGWPEFWCEVILTTGELTVAIARAMELAHPDLARELWHKLKPKE